MDRILMCPPEGYGVSYVINPWMEGQQGRVDLALAKSEWQRLHREVSVRARVELVTPPRLDDNLPDMVFTANAGLVLEDAAVLAQFRFAERQGEEPRFQAWFEGAGFRVITLPGDRPFEGEGDALVQPGQPLLWLGHGVRSSLDAAPVVADALRLEVVPLRLVDPRYYHLDTCFCPLTDGRLLWLPAAFDETSRKLVQRRIPEDKRIEASERDGELFACNALQLGNDLLLNDCTPHLEAALARQGLHVVRCPVPSFLQAGGGVKCLTLRLQQSGVPAKREPVCLVRTARVVMRGHLIDTGLLNKAVTQVTDNGLGCRVEKFEPGQRHDQESTAELRLTAPDPDALQVALGNLLALGAQPLEPEAEAHLEPCPMDGVAPEGFYATTIYPTFVRVGGEWIPAQEQRMDAVLVVNGSRGPGVWCALIRDLKAGDPVVCGIAGVRVEPKVQRGRDAQDAFGFMTGSASSERRVETAVRELAWEMKKIRERGGRIAVVGGPVVIHTGGGPYLERLVRAGYVQAILSGNALAVHDLESQMYGTSLGVDLARGRGVHEGHTHHLRTINRIRRAGSIAKAVEQRLVTGGLMHACVTSGVDIVLAGSIRDDGPLPDTLMDLCEAQAAYARTLRGCEMVIMLSTMLHSIGVGNMTPAGVKLVCVDINPAVVTKLADRGSLESVGIVTDVGLFLNLLTRELLDD
ncbi:MAG: TIGR00300 family protein [Planctomycetaceae bacterium]|nr:TIGR00300 family protein [Planctomycetaceae bacterium]